MRAAFAGAMLRRGIIAAAALATVASAGFAQRRIVVRKSVADSAGRDTITSVTIGVSSDDIARMIGDLLASHQLEERIAMAMRGQRGDEQRLRELSAQLQSIVKRNAGLMTAIRLQCAKEDELPEGYLGINFEGIETHRSASGHTMYGLGERPRIVSVEPGSPAQRAGLEPADEVIAIAGNDPSKPIALGTLLKPGAKVVVRVARDGRSRDVTVTVAKRPGEYGSPCAGVEDVVGYQRMSPQATFMWRSEAPARITEPNVARPPAAPGFNYTFVSPFATPGPNMIGGASLLPLDQEWRETLGVDKGLLVLAVAPGSPSQAAGLRKSDVLVAVGEAPLTSSRILWSAMNDAGPAGVTLSVLRGGRKLTIVLKPTNER